MKNLQIILDLKSSLREDFFNWLHKHTDKTATKDEIKKLAPLELKNTIFECLFLNSEEKNYGIPVFSFNKKDNGYQLTLNSIINNEEYDFFFLFLDNVITPFINEGNRIIGIVKNNSTSQNRKVLDFRKGKLGYCEYSW